LSRPRPPRVAATAASAVGLAAALLCGPCAASAAGGATVDVDVALVLVDDASRSISDAEYALQKDGYAAAFNDPRVQLAIQSGPRHQIAVAYVEFSDDFRAQTIVDWTVIRGAEDARAFATALKAADRVILGRTAIGAGIDIAVQDLDEARVSAPRRIIDVCGDGQNNSGRDVTAARDDALKQGIVINGLAIANNSPNPMIYRHTHPPGGLRHYYEENVIGGDGSFALQIEDYLSFAQAITRKLLAEISGLLPSPDSAVSG
jgi:hypothetical protein